MRFAWVADALIVGVGGFIGTMLRYELSGAAQRLAPGSSFPVGTLAVNVLGCLAIGVLGGLAETRQVLGPHARLFLLLGLLGGFTTYSTFGYETMALARDGEQIRAVGNVALHVVVGLSAVWIGLTMAKALEKIERFMPVVDGAVTEGLATIEPVEIRFYRSGRGETDAPSPRREP